MSEVKFKVGDKLINYTDDSFRGYVLVITKVEPEIRMKWMGDKNDWIPDMNVITRYWSIMTPLDQLL